MTDTRRGTGWRAGPDTRQPYRKVTLRANSLARL
jgi:hypothetical protein